MCGRYVLAVKGEDLPAGFDEVRDIAIAPGFAWLPQYNISRMQHAPVLIHTARGTPELALHRWGLVPLWVTDPKAAAKLAPTTANARSETISVKPAFRTAFKSRRCVVPASGFYEWTGSGGAKTPHYLSAPDGRLLFFAGLWESHPGFDAGPPLYTFSIVTCEPNDLVRAVHDRMPVLLSGRDVSAWIDPRTSPAVLATLMVPAANEALTARVVGPAVGSVKSNGPSLIEPVTPPRTLFG